MADRVGQEVGKYRLIRSLGSGGFAEVYLGEHIQLGTLAAIKLLHTGLMNEMEINLFRQEALIIANLIHPNIVRVLDFDAQAGMPYLVMDYAPGGSLRQKAPAGTILPLSLVLPAVQQIAQGLQFAHDHKIIHRDIKPQNLLIGRNNEVLLSDFGISIVAETTSRQQQSQGFSGTVAYAAPEQIQGHPHPESDQYALAMIVYEWLTGSPAFTGAMMSVMWNQVHTPPPSLRSKVPTILSAVEQVILKALSKDPKERYPTIQAFAYALAQAHKGSAANLTIPLPPSPPVNTPGLNSSNYQTPSSPLTSYSPTLSQAYPPSPSQPLQQTQFQPSIPQPQPFLNRQVLTTILIALIIVLLVGAGATAFAIIYSQSGNGGPQTITNTPTDTPVPTNTPISTDTPFPPTATPDPRAPYTAQVPGPASDGCDNGGGVWSLGKDQGAQVSCSGAGMTLGQLADSPYVAAVYFEGPRSGYSFPQYYTVSVDASSIQNTKTCVGLETHQQGGGAGGYSFLACLNGFWEISIYDNSSGHPTRLNQGYITGNASYHLQIAVAGSSQEFSVDGSSLFTLGDSTYTSTASVALLLDTGINGPGGSAVFSNFVYRPMP